MKLMPSPSAEINQTKKIMRNFFQKLIIFYYKIRVGFLHMNEINLNILSNNDLLETDIDIYNLYYKYGHSIV